MAKSTCLNCYGQKYIVPKTDDPTTNGVPITCPTCKGEGTIEQQPGRYPMCKDQPAQVDCRNDTCKFHVNAACTNVSPAITLTTGKGFSDSVMHCRCWSYEPKT